MILRAIAIALENMDQNFLELSRLDLSETGNVLPVIQEAKVLERPFAYEFTSKCGCFGRINNSARCSMA
ncbi:MAG: hypothetical protein U0836_11790 [Pirellulales bacterium]